MRESSSSSRLSRFLVYCPALFLILSALGYLFYQGWCKPSIEFLTPSVQSEWMLNPSGELSGSMTLRRRFVLEEKPARGVLKVKAMLQFSLAANGKAVEPDSQSQPRNWKRFRSYNLAPYLRSGKNTLILVVSNPDGPPALLVEGSVSTGQGRKVRLNSDQGWEIRTGPDRRWVDVKASQEGDVQTGENKGFLQSFLGRLLTLLLFIGYGVVLLLCFPRLRSLFKPASSPPKDRVRGPSPSPRWLGQWPFLAVFMVVLIINTHNALSFPCMESAFDGVGHVEYVREMAFHRRVPLATDGWEMYQPPLYYFVSSLVYRLFGGGRAEPGSLKAVQVMGMISGLVILLLTFLLLRRLFEKDRSIQLMGLSVVAFMPMVLYMNPVISNEVFSGSMMSLALYLLILFGSRPSLKLWRVVLLGAVVGLAMLSKVSALFIFFTAAAVLAARALANPSQRKHSLRALAVFLLVVVLLSGWFYFRNYKEFDDPFVGNWDKTSGFNFEQAPGYRTLGFYTRFGSVMIDGPERSLNSSFWDGNYASMWMDPFENFIKLSSERVKLQGRLILYLAFLPSLAILVGFFLSIKSAILNPRDNPDLPLVLLSLLWLFSGISFTLEVPFYSTVKAFFFISLLPALAVFAAKGFQAMTAALGKFRFLLYANLAILFFLIVNLFWFRRP